MPSPSCFGAPVRFRPLTGPTLALTLALSATTPGLHAQSARPAPSTARDTTALPVDDAAFAGRVDSMFAPWRGSDRPGCSVGVSHRGRVVIERAYGMANLESG